MKKYFVLLLLLFVIFEPCSALSIELSYETQLHDLQGWAKMLQEDLKSRSATAPESMRCLRKAVFQFVRKHPEKKFTKDFVSNRRKLSGLFYRDIEKIHKELCFIENEINKKDELFNSLLEKGLWKSAYRIYQESLYLYNKVLRGKKLAEYMLQIPKLRKEVETLLDELESIAFKLTNPSLKNDSASDVADLFLRIKKHDKGISIYRALLRSIEKQNRKYRDFPIRPTVTELAGLFLEIRFISALYENSVFGLADKEFSKFYIKFSDASQNTKNILYSAVSELSFKAGKPGLGRENFNAALDLYIKNPEKRKDYKRDYLKDIFNQNKTSYEI